jgi:predicted  nucleic acid-binding Zn-ribbon protein
MTAATGGDAGVVGASSPAVSVGEGLLALQAIDTQIDQLRHRRVHMRERADLAAREAQLAALAQQRDQLQQRRDGLQAETERLELEVVDIEDKAAYADRVLYGGTVKALKELTALQDEITRYNARKSDLEDRALSIMEDLDGLDALLAERDAERTGLDAEVASLIVAITEAEVAIDAELARLQHDRAELAVSLGDSVVARYETVRADSGGIGVARLEGTRCLGCHLVLPAMDVDRLRHLPAGEIARCPECDRLLVRL